MVMILCDFMIVVRVGTRVDCMILEVPFGC